MWLQYIQSMLAAVLISLSGSLPLGNLNIAAMQIAAKENARSALLFALGVVVVEMIYLIAALSLFSRLSSLHGLLFVFRIASVALLCVFAVSSFMAAARDDQKNVLTDNKSNRLVLGAGMSAINPMQLPFWAGWIIYLFAQSLLPANFAGFALFTLSAGCGTYLALLLFVLAGRRFSLFMRHNQVRINTAMAILFLLMAAFQSFKLL